MIHPLSYSDLRRRLLSRTLSVALLLGAGCWASGTLVRACAEFEDTRDWP